MKEMNNLQEKYNSVKVELVKSKKFANVMDVPRFVKVVINSGVGNAGRDKVHLEEVISILSRISGQKPVATKARVAISNFGIRRGHIVGVKVTVRGKRMWDFLTKFIYAVLPRVKDFRGISKSQIDSTGNLHIGIPEHTVFLEIDSNKVEKIRSLEVSIVLTGQDKNKTYELLKAMGFPFKD